MENKEMNTEKIKFHREHPVLLAWLISIFVGLGIALFLVTDSVIKYGQKDYVLEIMEAFRNVSISGILIGAVLVFPIVLTISEVICLISEAWERPVKGAWLFDQHVFWMGGFYELCYLGVIMNVTSADWQAQLSNSNKHTPIYSGSMVTFILLLLLAFLGYEILQSIPLRKLPPLVTVLSISAMYLGLAALILFTVQIFKPTDGLDGYWYLLLFPLCCVLLVARLLLKKIREWNTLVQNAEEEHFGTGKICQNPVLCWCDRILRKAAWWPVLGLVLMFPLLGILIVILMLFGQAPDSVIKAFTETSDWNLSLRQAPQNVMYDEHYLCTVAAGGHEKVVKPIRLGRRHGHEVIVNRQLCIANAFEQVLEERTPGFHRVLRHFYDTYGFPVARLIHSRYTADLVYFIMKPLEWIFLCVLYLTDAHPENRIAVQYTGKTAAQVEELYK